MVLGLLQLDIMIPESKSLKEKRGRIKSIKETVRNRFNVSVAEVGHQDKWGRSLLAFAKVSSEAAVIRKEFQKIEKDIERRYDVEIIKRVEEVW